MREVEYIFFHLPGCSGVVGFLILKESIHLSQVFLRQRRRLLQNFGIDFSPLNW